MTTAEAVWPATGDGARALRRDDIGYLAPGARADCVPLVSAVWQAGRLVVGSPS